MATQNYWFSEMGLWGSNPVETYEFGPDHHADLYVIFNYVHDYEVGNFMAYLQTRPHEFLLSKNSHPNEPVCATCEDLVDEFGVM